MQAEKQRGDDKRVLQAKSNLTLMSLAVTIVLVVLVVLGLSYAAPSRYFSRTAIGVIVLLVVLRMMTRRKKGQKAKAAEPDPQSRLNLHD